MESLNAKIDFQSLFSNLLAQLSDREQEVLKKRYQLTNELEDIATLKEIGDVYNITRERVRQIERDAIRKLIELARATEFSAELQAMESAYLHYLERNGGVVREDNLLRDYILAQHNFESLHPNAFLFVLEYFFDSTQKVEDHDYFYPVWTHRDIDLDLIVDLIKKLENVLAAERQLLQKEKLLALAEEFLSNELRQCLDAYLAKHCDLSLSDLLQAYLVATAKIEENIMQEWGLAHWENVRPKKLSDKINLVFQQEKKPLHFSAIADRIGQANFDHKTICAATVHNELIANPGFVLIGRGLYALKNWGYATGTVAEIIQRIIEQAARPLTKEEIFAEVLKQRQVNKSTIYLTLINRDKFQKTADNRFTVAG